MKPHGPPSSSLRSPQFVPRGPQLTNARITHYIRQGYYGAERQRVQALIDARRKARREPKPKPLAHALRALGL